MILGIQGIGTYVADLARSLYTRGFELSSLPIVELDDAGFVAFSIAAFLADPETAQASEISLDEIWRPLPEDRWERHEYTYDLIDRPRQRRRAFHLHDRELAMARFGSIVHEHCEEILGRPSCGHYLGRELRDGHLAISLLLDAWMQPGDLGCDSLTCL